MGNPKLAKILRCTGLALLVLGVLAFVPASAQAALHGAQILKGCDPSTNCNEDADCDNGLFCDGAETCSTISGTQPHVSCTIEVTNTDGFDDSLTLRTACDRVKPGAGDEFVDCTIEIISVVDNGTAGDTTCVVGQVLGSDTLANNCVIGHDDVVTFASVSYQIQAADPAPLPDQATVQETDNCDGTPSADCNSGQLNNLQASSQTTLTNNCVPGTPPCPEDTDLCTTITCNEDTNGCDTVTTTCPDDGNLCNGTPVCNPGTGACDPGTPTVCTPDADLCTLEACDPADGVCKSGPPTVCTQDADLCTLEACDPADGVCKSGTPLACPDDADLCNGTPFCDPATGACDPGTAVVCADPCFTCDPAAGTCTVPSGAPECNVTEICRTPGFWGTHGGTEKTNSQDITGGVLGVFGGTLSICGVTIDTTDEALQAICVPPKGTQRLQLARQLTSAALNCGITNAGDTCTGQNGALPCNGTSVEDVFNACNTACANNEVSATIGSDTFSCVSAIDCFNNGGVFNTADGSCDCANGLDENGECANSCHSQPLSAEGCFDNFVPPGSAGSSRACNEARRDCATIFGSQCP